MQKIIGIVPRTLMENGTYKIQLNYNYLEPFLGSNVSCIILPLIDSNIEKLLTMCDGFLIPGGGDLDPKTYNEENIGDSKEIDAKLDTLDKRVVIHAVKYKKPMLGICRGIQAINVFMGGTLFQDIEKANLSHNEIEHTHLVEKVYENKFTKQFDKVFLINSYHHQSVKDVANGFDVLFKHNEIIEGIMHKELPILAVQWHPEKIVDTKESKFIFEWFINQICAK